MTMRSSLCFDRTATMWKIFCLLSLTLFTFSFLRVSVVRGEPVPTNAELVIRDDDRKSYRQETRARVKDREDLTNREIHENGDIRELVGKWENNGEAIEPKWRDGDTMPLFPFLRFSRYQGHEIDANEGENDHVYRRQNHRQKNEEENAPRPRNNSPLFYDYEEHETMDKKRGYRERVALPSKRNSRPWINRNTTNIKETNNKNDERTLETVENRGIASTRYTEIFQTRPNEYERELNDEEYLKPRPRKRKPPQNYEFALIKNETNGRKIGSSFRSRSRANVHGISSQSEPKSSQFVQNAMELKSLLKMRQEEGLSLSEILQQRNLTLNDLLKGKADVIDALKMGNIDETEDYIEEAASMIPNPSEEPFVTAKPQWLIDTTSVNARNSQRNDQLVISIVPANLTDPSLRENFTNSKRYSTSAINHREFHAKVENSTTGKSIVITADSSRSKVTLLAPTTITTSIPLLLSTNSMERLHSSVKSMNNGEIKPENPDEDEIMEFSDFTDYKKERSGSSPVWLLMRDEDTAESTKLKGNYEDKSSTLSIEKILNPTERSESNKNSTNTVENDKQFSSDSIDTKTDDAADYSDSSDHEYQDDAPMMYHNLEYSTKINYFTDKDQRSLDIMEEMEYTSNATPYDVQHMSHAGKNVTRGLENHQNINTSEKKSYDDIVSEVEPEARAEIFELFASGSAGKRLERLLKARNMSLEELIALRQRGSSKVHLAEISRIKIKSTDEYRTEEKNNIQTTTLLPPKTDEEVTTTHRYLNYDEGFNNYLARSFQNTTNTNIRSNKVDTVQPDEGVTEESLSHLESKINKNKESSSDTHPKHEETQDIKEDHHSMNIIDLLATFGSMPFVKDIQRDLIGEYSNEDKKKLLIQTRDQGVIFVNNDTDMINLNGTSNVIQSGYVEEIRKQKSNSVDGHTIYKEMIDESKNIHEKRKILSNVKPNIIASGAILGVTIVVFLAIFIICRIRQKQKYRYRNTFSRAVFQGPVMTARKLSNSSSLSAVMVNVIATSTTKRPEKNETQENGSGMDSKSEIDNDSLDANDSWETIPDYMK